MADTLRIRDKLVTELRQSIVDGEFGIKHVPTLLKKILKDECWRERVIVRTGQLVKFERFADFITAKPLEGMGEDLDTIHRLCRDDAEALSLLDEATVGRQGARTDLVDNVNEVNHRPDGNSKQQALRKLRKDAPEVHADVVAGKISPHGGMVKAGFRRKPTTLEQLQKLWTKATPTDRASFLSFIDRDESKR